ncbi:hypothetical protein V8G54_035642 [Vigna mungo]|uniref:Uncharacterized protein n=1 Tax=Vigna mungo TaxID=3915 RepID=A0AAQ3MG81_VIGMU
MKVEKEEEDELNEARTGTQIEETKVRGKEGGSDSYYTKWLGSCLYGIYQTNVAVLDVEELNNGVEHYGTCERLPDATTILNVKEVNFNMPMSQSPVWRYSRATRTSVANLSSDEELFLMDVHGHTLMDLVGIELMKESEHSDDLDGGPVGWELQWARRFTTEIEGSSLSIRLLVRAWLVQALVRWVAGKTMIQDGTVKVDPKVQEVYPT